MNFRCQMGQRRHPGKSKKGLVSGAECRDGEWVGAVTRAGDVLHQGADQGLPAGLAQRLGSLFIREEAICKILLVTQNPVQSGTKNVWSRIKDVPRPPPTCTQLSIARLDELVLHPAPHHTLLVSARLPPPAAA